MDDMDKTIPPQRQPSGDTPENGGPGYVTEKTIPGRLERKPTGRYAVGDLILHRYKVLAELGQGGMGVVYKCFDETAGIEVALKALPPELSHNSLEMEDVKDNFQLVSKLIHQNIAASKTLERDPATGDYYLIMECIDGEDLRRWIKRKRKEGTLTPETVLPVLRQVADALDYAHAERVIHRDIKPGNIMINADGKVKVLDFGLAAQIHTSMTRVSMAYHGTSGTGPYMAPEQWRGRAQGAAADQYALAVMAYEMLAGHLPFESTDAAVLREAVLNDTPQELDNIPIYARNAIRRAMSKEPENRFASCADFVAAFSGKKVKAPKGPKSSRKVGIVVVLVLILALAGGGIVWHRISSARAEAARQAETEHQVKLEAEHKQQAERQRLIEAKKTRELAAKKQAENDTLRQEIYLLQSRAERRQKIIESAGYDRGQTFGKHLDECAEFTFAGVRAVENNDFASAKKYFESANASAEWIEKNAPLREQCKKILPQFPPLKKSANDLEAGKINPVDYKASLELLTDGNTFYQAGNFAEAQTCYEQSKNSFEKTIRKTMKTKIGLEMDSARYAKSLKNWQDVERISNTVLKLDNTNQEAKDLLTEAKQSLVKEKIHQLMEQALAAKKAGNWSEAERLAKLVLDIDATHSAARNLISEAKAKQIPMLKLIAMADDVPVTAQVILNGDKTQTEQSGKAFVLKKNKEYKFDLIYQAGAHEYRAIKILTCDWNGEKQQTIELKKIERSPEFLKMVGSWKCRSEVSESNHLFLTPPSYLREKMPTSGYVTLNCHPNGTVVLKDSSENGIPESTGKWDAKYGMLLLDLETSAGRKFRLSGTIKWQNNQEFELRYNNMEYAAMMRQNFTNIAGLKTLVSYYEGDKLKLSVVAENGDKPIFANILMEPLIFKKMDTK